MRSERDERRGNNVTMNSTGRKHDSRVEAVGFSVHY